MSRKSNPRVLGAPPLLELTGSGEDVTVTIVRNGIPVRVTAPRHVIADALALLPRMRELLEAGGAPPVPPLRLLKSGAT